MDQEAKQQFEALDKALQLQAKEYERRLEGLNGEAGRLREMQAQYTPRETFDNTMGRMNEKIDILNTWKIKQEGKSQLLQIVPWILTILSLISMWLMYKKI